MNVCTSVKSRMLAREKSSHAKLETFHTHDSRRVMKRSYENPLLI